MTPRKFPPKLLRKSLLICGLHQGRELHSWGVLFLLWQRGRATTICWVKKTTGGNESMIDWLVVEPPPEKYMSSSVSLLGWLFPIYIYGKIENIFQSTNQFKLILSSYMSLIRKTKAQMHRSRFHLQSSINFKDCQGWAGHLKLYQYYIVYYGILHFQTKPY